MSSGSYKQIFVMCPFYCYDDGKNTVICEGAVEKSYNSWRFRSGKDLRKQMDIFCCDHFQNCEIYRMLMENKYPDD